MTTHGAAAIINLVVENSTDVLSKVFFAMGDPIRRSIVARLADSDATVGELAEPFDVSLQAVSKHLRVLEHAGLVTKTKDAQRRTVRLEGAPLNLMSAWIDRYRRQAEERYRRLDAVLAEMNSTHEGRKRIAKKGRPS